jgi:hypothetical protein
LNPTKLLTEGTGSWLHFEFACRADAGRYPFIAADFHHLFLAGLPAHLSP